MYYKVARFCPFLSCIMLLYSGCGKRGLHPFRAGPQPAVSVRLFFSDICTFKEVCPATQIIHGDALTILPTLEAKSFHALITDPPYSSGGATSAAKAQGTSKKYCNVKTGNSLPDFEGDAKDQRSWTSWTAHWLSLAKPLLLEGSPVCVFCDFRQLPTLTDAIQWAGYIWRGVAVWDKRSSRPQKGRFRSQCEYIVWGSKGAMPMDRPVPVLPGVYSHANEARRIHQTVKPLALMREIVRITEPGGRILDPFAGSGTTVLAAMVEGYTAMGIEIMAQYAEVARQRIAGGVTDDDNH